MEPRLNVAICQLFGARKYNISYRIVWITDGSVHSLQKPKPNRPTVFCRPLRLCESVLFIFSYFPVLFLLPFRVVDWAGYSSTFFSLREIFLVKK